MVGEGRRRDASCVRFEPGVGFRRCASVAIPCVSSMEGRRGRPMNQATHSARRIALLLGATALTGLPYLAYAPSAFAQVVVGGKPPQADGGSDGFGDTRGDDGTAGPNVGPDTNNTDVTSAGTAYFGDARGGDGGDGGTAVSFCLLCLPPHAQLEGGDGGNGAMGGTVDITNTAHLSTSNGFPVAGYGMLASADGGRGGNAGWAFDLDLLGLSRQTAEPAATAAREARPARRRRPARSYRPRAISRMALW